MVAFWPQRGQSKPKSPESKVKLQQETEVEFTVRGIASPLIYWKAV